MNGEHIIVSGTINQNLGKSNVQSASIGLGQYRVVISSGGYSRIRHDNLYHIGNVPQVNAGRS